MQVTVNIAMFGPVLALISWSLLICIWMYATRLPAVFALKMRQDPQAPRGEQMALLPAKVRWKADNYNHLMEQPTLFYALAIVLALLNTPDTYCLALAWAYVVLRLLHSLVQVLTNHIETRFVLFILSNIPLFALTYLAISAFMQQVP